MSERTHAPFVGAHAYERANDASRRCCFAKHAFSYTGNSFHNASTNCEERCRANFKREGREGTCMPVKPECANTLGGDEIPKEEFVKEITRCICGPKLSELTTPGHTLFEGDTIGRRASESWAWPQGRSKGVDPFTSRHHRVSDQCHADIMAFRTDLLALTNASCRAYVEPGFQTLERAGVDVWRDTGFDPSSTNDQSEACDVLTEGADDAGACCVAPRALAQMSRVWRQSGVSFDDASAGTAFAPSLATLVGSAVHTDGSSAASGDLDGDALPDLLLGDRIYFGRNGFGPTDPGTRLGSGRRPFKLTAVGDVDGVAPDDVVVVYDDNAVEVFLSTTRDIDAPELTASSGVGFHSMGVVLPAHTASISTIAFLTTIEGHGATCRDTASGFGCTSLERAIFLGTLDTCAPPLPLRTTHRSVHRALMRTAPKRGSLLVQGRFGLRVAARRR